jgi:hypothetical protein
MMRRKDLEGDGYNSSTLLQTKNNYDTAVHIKIKRFI